MEKNYFRAFLFFIGVSFASIVAGLAYGFTTDVFRFIKPITVLQYSTFLAFLFLLNANRNMIEKSNKKNFWIAIGFFIAMVCFYEIMFNFFYWFSLYNFYGLGADLDTLRNVIQLKRFSIFNITGDLNETEVAELSKIGLYPVSLNVATKFFTLIFFASLYWIYVFHNAKRSEGKRK